MADVGAVRSVDTPRDFDGQTEDQREFLRWANELKAARKGPHQRWLKRCRDIIRRFRDEDVLSEGEDIGLKRNARFNVLWSNVNTLGPAIYSKPPTPIAERRYLDKDIVGRAASVILERCIAFHLDTGHFHEAMKLARQDYLLCGFATVWQSYEPEFKPAPRNTGEEGDGGAADDEEDGRPQPSDAEGSESARDEAGEGSGPEEVLAWETVATDYVHYSDELVSGARFWSEVRWRARGAWYTRAQLVKQFPEHGAQVELTQPKDKGKPGPQIQHTLNKALVWQIWDLESRRVIYICEDYTVAPLKIIEDPLKLMSFVPSARPLLGTTTNDSVWPIPDYTIYRDQAQELDNLTARIAALVRAIKVVGVCDGSIPELVRLFTEGNENKLIPVKNWAKLSQKGGLDGSISLVPVKELAETLMQLYQARNVVKADLYEVTGISDIVRGNTDPNETASAQNLKGEYADVRLSDRRSEFNRFVRDNIRLMAEIIAENFSDETLRKMSGFDQWAAEQDLSQIQPPMPLPMMGHNGGPALDGMPAPMPGMAPQGALAPVPGIPIPPQVPPFNPADELFSRAVEMLRNEKLRSFRIEIETDSTIEPNRSKEQEGRTQFVTAVTAFLEKGGQMALTFPQVTPLLGKMLLFASRGFRIGRDLESSMETLISELEANARNPQPKPPSPEEIRAKAEEAKAQREERMFQLEQQAAQQQQQADSIKLQEEIAALKQKHQAELQKMQAELEIKGRELQLKERELQLKERELGIKAQLAERSAEIEAEGMERERAHAEEMGEIKLEGARQAAEQKAQAARSAGNGASAKA